MNPCKINRLPSSKISKISRSSLTNLLKSSTLSRRRMSHEKWREPRRRKNFSRKSLNSKRLRPRNRSALKTLKPLKHLKS